MPAAAAARTLWVQLSTSAGLEYTPYARAHRLTQYDTTARANLSTAAPNYAPLAGAAVVLLRGANLSPRDVHSDGVLRCAFGPHSEAGATPPRAPANPNPDPHPRPTRWVLTLTLTLSLTLSLTLTLPNPDPLDPHPHPHPHPHQAGATFESPGMAACRAPAAAPFAPHSVDLSLRFGAGRGSNPSPPTALPLPLP